MSNSILLVEDNPDDIFLAKRIMKKSLEEYRVDAVSDVKTAVEKIFSSKYSVIVTDYNLPDGNALDIVRSAKDVDYALPVVVTTSAGNEKIAVALMKEGVNDYIVKDYAFEDTLPAVVERSVSHANDLRERLRLEQAIRLSEVRYRMLVQTISDIIYELDSQGNFLFVSPAIEQLGYSVPEITGQHFSVIVHPDDRGLLGKAVNFVGVDPDDDFQTVELRLVPAGEPGNGSEKFRYFELRATPNMAKSDSPELIGSIGVIRDVTDRKETEEQLRQSHEEMKRTQQQLVQAEKMASLGQLSAGIAHEINNPLCFINSNVFVLKEYNDRLMSLLDLVMAAHREVMENDGSVSRELIERFRTVDLSHCSFFKDDYFLLLSDVHDGVERIKEIVEDLRIFCRDDYEKEYANVNDIFKGILNIVWNQIRFKAELTTEYGNIPFVLCNNQKIGQIFINLLVNAAHALPEEGGKIKFKSYMEDGKVIAEVSDNGHGMSPQVMSKIFDPFFTTKKVGEGTGLGLSICYDIIKQHGGDITVQSAEGQGTAFKISFPPIRH